MNTQKENQIIELGGEMSFMEHLDELRRRLINSVIIILIAFIFCWFVSDKIFGFLEVPVRKAMTEAQRREVPIENGLTGDEKVYTLDKLSEGEKVRYAFDRATKFGNGVVSPGTAVSSIVARDRAGKIGLFTDEPILTNNAVIPKGVRLPVDFENMDLNEASADEQMVVTTAGESFTLLVTVSLYSAIALSIPLLLWQIWGFISPALYKHERSYVTPFILLSTISFVIGAAFAYYVLFPPALRYLLGLGENFRLMLRASDYFDFITLIMLAMGIIFQMPAITYVLARIGLVSAGLLSRSWKIAIVVILLVAAIISPTGDIPNLMLFAAPMIILYIFSIFIAWIFGKKRKIIETQEI